ncbi:uncharacterized protein N0V89_002072 [Didymosphaeria variabile]|uniref:Uncharacterized protein n=1 Tax=Didymosphaeria variabile TaxID=1932322 RepID=A0A9W8XRE8_9PLEO|nr:uncharacterized protein N0V89_002072 [Didymosphaeria variabile]KAJ4357496.1 hypothetical protein N0V89_002072 [Didymosphaeria variabile]
MAFNILVISDLIVEKTRNYKPDLIGEISSGMRSVSLEILTPPTSPPVSIPSVVGSSKSTATSDSINVPHRMYSPQTFQYLGFSPNVAKYLFGKLEKRMEDLGEEEPDLLAYWQSYVRHKCDEIEDTSDDWEEAMDSVGIHGRMRNALLDPKHVSIRGIQSLSSWLCEMIETNYDALIDLPDTILLHVEPDHPYIRGGGFEVDYSVPATLGGHINLFKSVALKRARNVIAEDGTIDLVDLQSSEGTDFAIRGGLYFTHQMWVATHYSRLIGDACPVCDRRTIEISVPLEHLKKENMLELDFGGMWKRLIFYSRRCVTYPKDVSRLRSDHHVVHGPIAHTANQSFSKMKDPEEIQKKHMLWEFQKEQKGKLGKQYVWLKEEAVERLSEVVREKVWMRRPEQSYALVESP